MKKFSKEELLLIIDSGIVLLIAKSRDKYGVDCSEYLDEKDYYYEAFQQIVSRLE